MRAGDSKKRARSLTKQLGQMSRVIATSLYYERTRVVAECLATLLHDQPAGLLGAQTASPEHELAFTDRRACGLSRRVAERADA